MKYLPIAISLLVIGLILFWLGRRKLRQTGLAQTEVVYADNEVWQVSPRALRDRSTGLIGKPDYIIRGKNGSLIPLEYKSSNAPASPYDAHIQQLLAYCRLVEVNYKQRPSFGILRYKDKEFQVFYTNELEDALLTSVREVQTAAQSGKIPNRSHQSPARCNACGFRDHCDQRL